MLSVGGDLGCDLGGKPGGDQVGDLGDDLGADPGSDLRCDLGGCSATCGKSALSSAGVLVPVREVPNWLLSVGGDLGVTYGLT